MKEALKGSPPLTDKLIWIARTGGDKPGGKEELLRVDWKAIPHGDSDATNYTLRCGDYLFVADQPSMFNN